MSHQDVSVMRALSTGKAVQRARRCAEKNKPAPREFRSDHLLLHCWDFHDVLCRLDNRTINKLHCSLEFLRNVNHRP